jgi:hypothetical protein
MSGFGKIEVPKYLLGIANNVYEIERKVHVHGDAGNISRNVSRLKDCLTDAGLVIEDPMGQMYKETRTDLDASISGTSVDDLCVTEVIKPIVRWVDGGYSSVVQRGIVIVEGKTGDSK